MITGTSDPVIIFLPNYIVWIGMATELKAMTED